MPSEPPDPLAVPQGRRQGDSAPIVALSALVAAMALVGLAGTRQGREAPPPPKSPVVVESPAAAALREGRPLDLNTATPAELELLPRVGPAIAGRIAEARPFRTVDELTRVRGIGERTLERLRPLVTVDEGASLAPDRADGYLSSSPRATEPGAGASR